MGHQAFPAPDFALADGGLYTFGAHVTRTVPRAPAHQRGAPLRRPLRIYVMDPGASRRDGSIATIDVPFEQLKAGPAGRLFLVDPMDYAARQAYQPADLDSPHALLRQGYDPSPSDPRFHQQMAYAVCANVYCAFRRALGRDIAWGFLRIEDAGRLYLRPHAFQGANACYDKVEGTLNFGYAPISGGGYVFTALSHDVVAHEVTHAILDGLRSNFEVPSGADTAAFHEAFSDLVALFQRLSYPELVREALRGARGLPEQAAAITELARHVGQSDGKGLRTALGTAMYDESLEAHELGEILLSAVFEAFAVVYRRKSARFMRLATQGSGILPPGELQPDLLEVLTKTCSRLAEQFLTMLIRAIDYCPPVDLRFGEYLRALITADHELVPDDGWDYRSALISAFAARGIYPRHVVSLTEDSLLWRPPLGHHSPLRALSFAELQFEGDPACAASPDELMRQARVIGEYVSRPAHAAEFGLLSGPVDGVVPDLPRVDSIRSARRTGPDGQLLFDLVAEITQHCRVLASDGRPEFSIWGGSTVILGPDGEIRYIISKSVTGADRIQRRLAFMQSPSGSRYWRRAGPRMVQAGPLVAMLHASNAAAIAHT
jgi:hypothetical protein